MTNQPSMPTVTFVAGLPGSGKSRWIEAQAQLANALVIDDFKANAHNDDPGFASSRHLPDLAEAIQHGRTCFVADIDFCRSAARSEADLYIATHFTGTVVKWVFFENDVAACEANVRRDAGRSMQARLAKIAEFATQYQIPHNACRLAVWSAKRGA